jgi:hypothetical protein
VARPANQLPQPHRGLELWQWVYIGAGVVILVAILVTVFTRPPQPTAAANTAPKQWVTFQHFTGSQSMQTYAFHVAKGNRILWIATPTSSTNSITITMSTSNGSVTTQVSKAADISGIVSETYTVHGDYDVYLTIAAEAINYDIKVQANQ